MKRIEDYKGTKTAIKVNSIEEFDKIKKLLGHNKQSGAKCFSKINNCVSCISDDYCDEKYWLALGFTIYPASDFLEQSIPEYVELLPNFDYELTGKIFNTNQPYPESWSRSHKSWQWLLTDVHKQYFKPSTKEAYLNNLVKEIDILFGL